MPLIAIFLILVPISYLFFFFHKAKLQLKDKKILIIGGSSGLGLSLAKYLFKLGNDVTITSRSEKRLQQALRDISINENPKITGQILDVLAELTQEESVQEEPVLRESSTNNKENNQFDCIFYCPGIALPNHFPSPLNPFIQQIRLNYLAMIHSLLRYIPVGPARLQFVVFSSTAALFPVPGYASYAPSKAAIGAFAHTTREELARIGVDLTVVHCCAMATPGLAVEDSTKPPFTRAIEYLNTVADPDLMAQYLVGHLGTRRSIAYDWFTYLAMIRGECECFMDYLLFPTAVVVMAVSRWYVSCKFRIS